MKFFPLLLASIMAFAAHVFGQECSPDATLSDTLIGVFPMPYHETLNPSGGISDSACVGHEYNFVFTAVIGDTFKLGATALPLDYLALDKEKALIGLPKGLKYACNPPDCIFKKNTKGCVVLYGKPEEGTEGKHLMKISGKLYANGLAFGLPLTFPDPSIAPGEYAVIVAAKNEGPCKKLAVQNAVLGNEIQIFPNPTHDLLQIEIALDAKINIYSSVGQLLQTINANPGTNTLSFAQFNPGIVFIEVIDQKSVQVFKVQKL